MSQLRVGRFGELTMHEALIIGMLCSSSSFVCPPAHGINMKTLVSRPVYDDSDSHTLGF